MRYDPKSFCWCDETTVNPHTGACVKCDKTLLIHQISRDEATKAHRRAQQIHDSIKRSMEAAAKRAEEEERSPRRMECKCLGCRLEAMAHHCAKRNNQVPSDSAIGMAISRLKELMETEGLRVSDSAPSCYGSGLVCLKPLEDAREALKVMCGHCGKKPATGNCSYGRCEGAICDDCTECGYCLGCYTS